MKFPFVLWKPRAADNTVRFLNVEDLPNAGLRSVYQYSATDADSMHDLDSFKAFKGTVYSEELLIDTDTEASSTACEGRLKELGLAFQKFTTGNRGNHYHVKRVSVAGHTLPASDRLYVEREFPGADTSFYHHVGLYRCIGATHAKTGLKKELLYSVEGKLLDLQPSKPAELTVNNAPNTDLSSTSVFLDETLRRLTVPYGHGERHKGLVNISLALHRLKQPFEFALGYLHNVSLMCAEPVEVKDLIRILEWTYYNRDGANDE